MREREREREKKIAVNCYYHVLGKETTCSNGFKIRSKSVLFHFLDNTNCRNTGSSGTHTNDMHKNSNGLCTLRGLEKTTRFGVAGQLWVFPSLGCC